MSDVDVDRLAALDRCKECIRAAAAQDRDTRSAAEARVSQKQQRQVALERLGDLYLEFAASAEGRLWCITLSLPHE